MLNMAWPCHGGEDVPDMQDLTLLQRSSIYDLLKGAQIPFIATVDVVKPSPFGVVLVSNIPYGVTREEATHFLGSDYQYLANHNGACPIHIMMERSTGKTMDCYFEFITQELAERVAARLRVAYDARSAPKMGSRHVEVELSSQNALLKALFPLAKCVTWENGSPVLLENVDKWSTGFDGFLTDEELFCLGRHSDAPHRSAFASKVPQRCYESIITTIWKFPWYATGMYTIHTRNQVFDLLKKMVDNLRNHLQRTTRTVGLDQRLLRELAWCGVLCPGFNPRQKYSIAYKSGLDEFDNVLDHDWCLYFSFDTLNYADDHPLQVYQSYAFLVSKGSVSSTEVAGLHNRHTHPKTRRLFGRYFFQWEDEPCKNILFKDAIDYEMCILRQFIITGFRDYHEIPRHDSDYSIGAPPDSPTASERSIDSQRTISALPPTALAHPASANRELIPIPAPARSRRQLSLGQAIFDQGTPFSPEHTVESGNSQTRSQRQASSPDARFSLHLISSGHQQASESGSLQRRPRRHMSSPEQARIIDEWDPPIPKQLTDSESSQIDDDGSSSLSPPSTPRPAPATLNYTDANFRRPTSPKQTRFTRQSMRLSKQLDDEVISDSFDSMSEPHMSKYQNRAEFDREWRFPYEKGAPNIPPPSAIPMHRAMQRPQGPEQAQQAQAPPIPLYRTPHHRATSSTYSQAPTYHVPHATAQNIRSHSDPFAPGPYEASSSRSRSDIPSEIPPINTPFFDSVRQGQRERYEHHEYGACN
ncbi:hypothetical protein N7499_001320 [Penicillium canescens]|uniref:Uncharacterized protein n=1 Tax=Penicillium canescens TaxID=5083 RepID=A0AAD6I3M1_PENCN|nr:hypothetical protein N7460_012679 [Penicillium canescens]KAJ6041144.1 hypothetical protein N7444_010049 [Penicillium canescens]KAJ6101690.1 hypothetical protein N7499_001320 [Penicillium canescens]KAJ6174152.1 hypothetical protein N7485_006964 [Penicillium canescens]